MSYGDSCLLPEILLTSPVVSRELVRNEALQECIDLICTG